jgi:hypothetical protein
MARSAPAMTVPADFRAPISKRHTRITKIDAVAVRIFLLLTL